MPPVSDHPNVTSRHGRAEDAYALVVGSLLLTLGLMLLTKAGLVTGGVVGIALVLSYLTGLPIGLFIVALTVPSLVMALNVMGRAFAIKTLLTMTCLVAMTTLAPKLIEIANIGSLAAAIVGGSVIGMGARALARHGAATGGTGVIILWLYRKKGWNAGRTQIALDGMVLASASVVVSPFQMVWSIIGLIATAGILYVWHRPGRYTGY
jgi:uncharacterized membrane-anchored protein YitT (DUF2179 family)